MEKVITCIKIPKTPKVKVGKPLKTLCETLGFVYPLLNSAAVNRSTNKVPLSKFLQVATKTLMLLFYGK